MPTPQKLMWKSYFQMVGVAALVAFAGYSFASVVLWLCIAALHLGAPRHLENSRLVPSMPWPWFAGLPIVATTTAGVLLGLFVPHKRSYRLAFILGVALGLVSSGPSALHLLHRDFIGKF